MKTLRCELDADFSAVFTITFMNKPLPVSSSIVKIPQSSLLVQDNLLPSAARRAGEGSWGAVHQATDGPSSTLLRQIAIQKQQLSCPTGSSGQLGRSAPSYQGALRHLAAPNCYSKTFDLPGGQLRAAGTQCTKPPSGPPAPCCAKLPFKSSI